LSLGKFDNYMHKDIVASIDAALCAQGPATKSVCPGERACQPRVLVFAAGNDGSGYVVFPARLSASRPVVAVGATDLSGQLKKRNGLEDWGSNFGKEISVVAPGVNIVTTDRSAEKLGYCEERKYARFGGTSAAAPVVAGIAALIQSRRRAAGLPLASPACVRKRLRKTAEYFREADFDYRFVRAGEAVGLPGRDSDDSDNDGIRDWLDCCSGTPESTVVGVDGCPAKQGLIGLPTVNFATNSATLTTNSRAVLTEAAAILLRHPTLKFKVAGYTDSVGTAEKNLELSRSRAFNVHAFLEALIERGVEKPTLTYQGYGEAFPVSSNDTSYGRAANRRVVLMVVSQP
jgi:outer membrane protein OmpA-like peptidoglycan-associated protein